MPYSYRHYATLYFVFAVDHSESQLGMLDLIQVFVESLDHCFTNVCELDLIFNSEVSGPRSLVSFPLVNFLICCSANVFAHDR